MLILGFGLGLGLRFESKFDLITNHRLPVIVRVKFFFRYINNFFLSTISRFVH